MPIPLGTYTYTQDRHAGFSHRIFAQDRHPRFSPKIAIWKWRSDLDIQVGFSFDFFIWKYEMGLQCY